MEYTNLASVSGKGGIFKVIKPTKSGMILESLDAKKRKLIVGVDHQVSVLNDISIYTTDKEGSVPLSKILHKIHEEFADDLGVDSNSTNEELRSFLKYILPNHDEERVYLSDIKKIINWYKNIFEHAKHLLNDDGVEVTSTD